ncbi:MAG: hypothetical protein ACYCU0_13570 [Solirubrobacteraceae bacterium]
MREHGAVGGDDVDAELADPRLQLHRGSRRHLAPPIHEHDPIG